MKEREMFNNFKSDMGMTDVEWRLFCQRYAIRGKSTVLWYFIELYGNLPKGFEKWLKQEMLTVCRSNSFNNAPVLL